MRDVIEGAQNTRRTANNQFSGVLQIGLSATNIVQSKLDPATLAFKPHNNRSSIEYRNSHRYISNRRIFASRVEHSHIYDSLCGNSAIYCTSVINIPLIMLVGCGRLDVNIFCRNGLPDCAQEENMLSILAVKIFEGKIYTQISLLIKFDLYRVVIRLIPF